ncbi:MAG: hypothetical protein CM1200mP12_20920 [Gammaproteobacteria bacterium]|nr:MAG: hypothetical protein CM1200mP12_20920 [Gammaproteobacteria bacterium]
MKTFSDEVKEKLDGAIAVHDFAGFRKRLEKNGVSEEEIEAFNKKYPMPEHPVIRTHPDTGKKLIYVNAAFTQYIKDWDADESSKMLKFLYSKAATPEYQCRFVWEDNFNSILGQQVSAALCFIRLLWAPG